MGQDQSNAIFAGMGNSTVRNSDPEHYTTTVDRII